MIIFKQAADLAAYIQKQKKQGFSVGFVPTMGALHSGHLSLIKQCCKENNIVVCSIFINPTQFNNKEDFAKYPVTIEKDIELLTTAVCQVLFLPSIEEMYPPGHVKKHYELGMLENILEGKYRPGHFQGVCEVVDRLLEVVAPHKLYLGQKDLQQCMVIKSLLEQYHSDIVLKIAPTVREIDGLALSSRNMRLTPEQRKNATGLYRALTAIKKNEANKKQVQLVNEAHAILLNSGFVVDYVAIVDKETLMPANENDDRVKVALIAATIGSIRLIDNMVLD